MAAKKEKYRLEALLKVRLKNKRNAEIELARSVSMLKEEERILKELEHEKEKIIERRAGARREMSLKIASGESQVSESHGHLNFIKKLLEDAEKKTEEIHAQEQQVERAKEKVAQAKRDYIDACREVKIMEKHKEIWKKQIVLKREKAEAKEMNELGNVLHQLRGMREKQESPR